MSNRNYCVASGVVFLVVALMHIWRFALDLPLQIGVWYVPRSLSMLGAIGAVVLALWAFRSARNPPLLVVYS
jgi:hypothetical protein